MLRFIYFCLCVLLYSEFVIAETASNGIILTVSGKSASSVDVQLDEAAFAKLPKIAMNVPTPWYPTPQTFEGPLLRDILKIAKINSGMIKLIALNDYIITIPVSDALEYDVIVARNRNGQPMTIRDKGPLFVIYPFHKNKELMHNKYYRRCSWQLRSIKAE
jgi:hypothetical protein